MNVHEQWPQTEICKLLVIPKRIWKFLLSEDLGDKEKKCQVLHDIIMISSRAAISSLHSAFKQYFTYFLVPYLHCIWLRKTADHSVPSTITEQWHQKASLAVSIIGNEMRDRDQLEAWTNEHNLKLLQEYHFWYFWGSSSHFCCVCP